ncbi:MAG: SPFH domain-containing protein [Phycisphaerales bacterium]|jgi:regulator of protease activity HflC (stomatin/prohibitin superfamily)
MTVSSKRPEHIAVVSLILSIIFFGIAFLLGRWSGFFAVSAISWLLLSCALIWLVLCLQFHQYTLAEQEKLDMGQLSKDENTSTIFQASGERAGLFAAAQRRLQIFEKWFIPLFSILIAAFQLSLGLYLLKTIWGSIETEVKQPLLCAICMTAIAFVNFLISRYATGMSAQPQWKPLRAGGSSLLGTAVLCFALAIGLAFAQFKIFIFVNIINWTVPILLTVLGAETALNLIMDIYRPRIKELYSRSAFDSRLLGTINEPGGIFRSAASAIDYQFGFEVSQTWFYKLLEKAIIPLVLFAAVTLYLLSCIVVVGPNEEAIIERFGNPVKDANDIRLLGPGLAFKWPWPIDIIYKYPTKKVMEINIGFVPKAPEGTDKVGYGPLLWGAEHYEEEYHLLVASEQTSMVSEESAVPVSLVMAAVPIQYRVKDLYSFIYNHNEPEKRLKVICYRELTKFAASAKIEVDTNADLKQSLFGAGRSNAKKVLTGQIQKAADEAGLGVEIVFLGLQGIHPPPEVAADYQAVVGAVQKEQALILKAQAERNKDLISLAGSVTAADELYNLIVEKERMLDDPNSPEVLDTLGNEVATNLEQAKGDIFTRLTESKIYAFEKATLAKATSERFASQIKAYKAAKQIYKRLLRLSMLEDALNKIRKYVVAAEPDDQQIYIIDVQEKLTPSIYDVTGIQESSEK